MIRGRVSSEAIFLAIGDLVVYLFSLIIALTVRYGALPGRMLLAIHLQSFWVLFICFLLVNFSIGLYDVRSSFRRGRNSGTLLSAQIVNAAVGIAYFYFIPASIAPKENLFIFFVVSTAALYLWRSVIFPVISSGKRLPAVLIGSGDDIDDIAREVDASNRYGMYFKERVAPRGSLEETTAAIKTAVAESGASIIVADLHDPAVEGNMQLLYSFVFSGATIIDAGRFYEAIFGRVPLTMVGERWLVENSGTALGNRRVYDVLKRGMDIVVASLLGLVSLLVYPFVWGAIKLDDGGALFVTQQRIGKKGQPISIVKFRSMSADDGGAYQGGTGRTALTVTRVGKVIRMLRIDELPQLWSVISGDQSLIGPRPELGPLVKVYEAEIPYYNARHLITPGLSGWAQIYHRAHPHHAVAVDEARNKLSYDLYYVKNRSFMLDLKIALQTLRALVSRQGV